MHILIVSPYFYPAWHYGGPPRVAFEFAKSLVRAGHQVTVCTTDTLNRQERIQKLFEEIDGVKIHYFRNRSNRFSAYFLYFNPLGLRRFLETEIARFDVVHLNEFRTHMTYDAARLAKRHGKPVFLHPRGALRIIMGKFFLKRLFDLFYGKWMLKNATRIVALTPAERDVAISLGISPTRIFVSPDCIRTAEYRDLPARDIKRRQWSLSDHDRVILHLGRLHAFKGLDLLVQALHHLREKPYQVVLAGPDFGFAEPLRQLIRELALPHVIRFLGPVEGEEKKQILAATDVMVLASRSEGLPGAVLEAMACGLPVIVSRFCNLGEIADYRAGLIVDLEPQAIASALRQILDAGEETRREFGDQGKKLIQEHFQWEAQIKRFESLYQEVLRKQSNTSDPK